MPISFSAASLAFLRKFVAACNCTTASLGA